MERSIAGPYAYGNTPPAHLCGWAGAEPGTAPAGLAAVGMRAVMQARDFLGLVYGAWSPPAEVIGPPAAEPRPFVWEYAKQLNGGKHLPTLRQLDGDCVAQGMRHGLIYRSAWEIARNREEEVFRLPFGPWIYGISRVDIGGGKLGREAGSLGSWAAEAVKRFGVLYEDDPDVPAYSLGVSEAWGRQLPARHYAEALPNLVESAAPLDTTDQVRDALTAEDPCIVTIASMQGWAMQPVEYKGRHCFSPEGSFAHQTVFLDWMDDPFPAAYRLNSWGPDAHGTPLNDEPPGGAWWRDDHLTRELKGGQCEAYAVRLIRGHPGPPNHGLV